MKKYKFITIKENSLEAGCYVITNNMTDEYLGAIRPYPSWRKHVLMAVNKHSVWSVDCLEDVINFIKNEIPKEK